MLEPTVHFSGSARDAALEYPKNANVAEGDFGRCEFRIEGKSLPDNPRSSAITAMSVVREILNLASPVVI